MNQNMALLLIFEFLRKKKVAKLNGDAIRAQARGQAFVMKLRRWRFLLIWGGSGINSLFIFVVIYGWCAKVNHDVNALSRGAFTVGG